MKRASKPGLRFLLCAVFVVGCSGSRDSQPEVSTTKAPPVDNHLFTMMPPSYTGVRFINRVEDTPEMNVFTYRNFYNGGGVAIGDLNGDGLPEILLTSNEGESRLYLNGGDYRFRDVTEEA